MSIIIFLLINPDVYPTTHCHTDHSFCSSSSSSSPLNPKLAKSAGIAKFSLYYYCFQLSLATREYFRFCWLGFFPWFCIYPTSFLPPTKCKYHHYNLHNFQRLFQWLHRFETWSSTSKNDVGDFQLWSVWNPIHFFHF